MIVHVGVERLARKTSDSHVRTSLARS